jgi:hypothetical protein
VRYEFEGSFGLLGAKLKAPRREPQRKPGGVERIIITDVLLTQLKREMTFTWTRLLQL